MKIRFFILSLLLLSLLTACITASRTIPAISHYSLIYQAPQKNNTSTSPIFDYVKVDRPSLSSQHSTEGIIYSTSPYQLDVYSLSVWQKPLTILFQDWLWQSREDSQLFTGIMRVTSRSKVSLFLESDIVKFQHHVKIYTVGVGSKGRAPFLIHDPVFGDRYIYQQVDIDEDTLKDIAAKTGGLYFRAKNTKGLNQIYATIDRLEKTEVKIKTYDNFKELYLYFLMPSLVLLGIWILLSNTRFLRVP